jgi:hypothetical protein
MANDTIKSINNFIARGDYGSALDYMTQAANKLLKDRDMQQKLRLLQGQGAKLEQDYRAGHIKYADYQAGRSRIGEALIRFQGEIEQRMDTLNQEAPVRDVEIELLTYTNAYACTIKDIDMLAKTFHSKIPNLKEVLKANQAMFDQVDVMYDIRSIELTALEDDFATATVLQRTTARRPNSGFRDNDLTASQTYMKDQGLWKIYAQVMQQVRYL